MNILSPARSEAVLFVAVATLVAMTSVAFLPADSWFYFYSLSPAFTAIFMLLATGGFRNPLIVSDLGLHRPAIGYWPAAAALGLLPAVVVWGLGAWSGIAPVDWASFAPWQIFYLIPSFTFTAFGEEVGFRGYWLPRLADLGRLKTTLFSALFWSAWHWPLYFIGFQEAGNDLLVVITSFTLMVIPVVFILNELRLRTNSIWPSTIFHCLTNASAIVFVAGGSHGSVTGLLLNGAVLAATSIGAVLLYFTGRSRTRQPVQ